MDHKTVASFSLLAYINDNNIGIRSFEDIFIPIVKSALCKMNETGYDSGDSVMEIKKRIDIIYSLDIPMPLLRTLLGSISKEYEDDDDNHFVLYKDGAFQMKKFLFADFEDELLEREMEIDEVNQLYIEYLTSLNVDYQNEPSLFDFIDQSRLQLSKYFAFQEDAQAELEFGHQANFINSIKRNKKIYEIIRRIYLGSIFSAYLQVDIGQTNNMVELLLDTNFIIGLLDLNSEESTHTCRKILEICNRIGYTVSVLPFTIEETEMLIERKAIQLQGAFFQGYLDPESIYNAAKRRSLTKTQLDQLSNNLKSILDTEYNIKIIGNDQNYRNSAKYKYHEIYEFYQKLRGVNGFSALHDATVVAYVKEKRGGKPIKGTIQKANCWFVTNTHHKIVLPSSNGFLPEIIRADEILNYLWLSNPNVTALINSGDLSTLGLTSLVSNTISNSLPRSKVLKTLDDNFNKYASGAITADDTIMIATMIARKQIKEPEELNRLATRDSESFIQTVKEYAETGRLEERAIQEKLNKVLMTFETAVRLKQQEKAEKELSISQADKQHLEEIESLKRDNTLIKRRSYQISILFSLSLISVVFWASDSLFNLTYYQTVNNYIFVKVAIQALLITLTCAIFTKQNRAPWITGTIALSIAVIMLLKK